MPLLLRVLLQKKPAAALLANFMVCCFAPV
jgi:hypothetical protein